MNKILTFSTPPILESHQVDVEEHMGGIKDFIAGMKQGMFLLGDDIRVQDLLLPQWCRIHHQEHSEISYLPCQNKATKLMIPVPCQNKVTKLMIPVPCEDNNCDTTVEEIEKPNYERVILQREKITIEAPQPE